MEQTYNDRDGDAWTLREIADMCAKHATCNTDADYIDMLRPDGMWQAWWDRDGSAAPPVPLAWRAAYTLALACEEGGQEVLMLIAKEVG